MQKIYRNRGSISIILLIILVPTLVFSALMIDIARQELSKAALEQATKLTLNSVLADYDTVLKDMYGLFAISQDPALSDRQRSELLIEQFNANMHNIILLSPDLEDIQISCAPGYSLVNPEVLNAGILEFMKYRGPVAGLLSLIDSFELFTKIGLQSNVAEQKMDVELGYRDVSAKCAQLYRVINSYDSNVEMYLIADKQLRDSIYQVMHFSDTENEEYLDAYNKAYKSFHNWKELSPAEMADYAITQCISLQGSLVQLEQLMGKFKQTVVEYGESVDNANYDAFYNTMIGEVERYEKSTASDKVEELIRQLKAAKKYLNSQSYETVEEYLSAAQDGLLPVSHYTEGYDQALNHSLYYHSEDAYLKLIGEVAHFEDTVFGVPAFYVTLISSFGGEAVDDERGYGNGRSLIKGIRELNERARQDASVEEAYAYPRCLLDNVPSTCQDESSPTYFGQIEGGSWYDAVSQYREMSSKVTDLLTIVSSGAKDLISDLYLSEYIIRNFSYLTSDADQITMTRMPVDPEHNLIYGCEVEYILFGNKGCSEKKLLWFTVRKEAGPESNLATAKTNIFAIRFVCNSIYALTDPSIDEATLVPALSIQAATGGVVPYYLIQLTAKLALALAESTIDMDMLVRGERVALFKSSSTWRCSAQGVIEMLKDRVTTEIPQLVDSSIQKGIGFLQRCIDDTAVILNTGVADCIDGISSDIGTAISSQLDQIINRILSALLETAQREFESIFTTGYFDRQKFMQSARTEVNSLVQGLESKVIDVLLVELPFIENVVIDRLADILETVIPEDDEPIKIDQVMCSKITSELKGYIATSMKSVRDSLESEIDSIVSAAGEALMETVAPYGEKLSEAAAKELTTSALNILNQYIPTDNYSTGDIADLGRDLYEMKPGRINEKILCLSYEEYLQILLALKLSGSERDSILLRVADVIQLNISLTHFKGLGFRMEEAYTYVVISGNMKVNSLLLPEGLFCMNVKVYDSAGY